MDKIKNLRNKTKTEKSTNGIFNKITKRYSTVSSKFLRKSPVRNGVTQPISGSYDMTGNDSDDHRIEIGAPVLISKTYLDENCDPIVTPELQKNTQNGEIKNIEFKFFPEIHNCNGYESSVDGNSDLNTTNKSPSTTPKPSSRTSTLTRRKRSKSANNICKTEMKVYLEKAPSLVQMNKTNSEVVDLCYDFPKKNHKPVIESDDEKENQSKTKDYDDSIAKSREFAKELLLTIEKINTSHNFSDYDSDNEIKTLKGSIGIQPQKSNETLNLPLNNNDIHYLSKESFRSENSYNDFDLKSVSFESLHDDILETDDYMSVKDMNWIKEEFEKSLNLEYCDHRNNLKPCERRITLLRNKNSSKINVNIGDKKEKLNHAWSGVKSWIGEEKGKIKEVVQRHAALQRVGAGNIVKNQAFFDKMIKDETIPSQRASMYSHNPYHTDESTPEREFAQSNDSISYRNNSNLPSTSSSHIAVNQIGSKCGSEEKAAASFGGKSNRGSHVMEGQNGFEELRRYVKQGGDFGKDLVTVLQERIEAEQMYAKSLSKMASKLSKACREVPGTIADAWRGVATEMESRGDVHRQFSNSLNDDIVKPLKNILDNQHKARKAIESNVDKSLRTLSEWRTSEGKAKKNSHTAARENEKLQDAMLDVRITRSPSMGFLHHTQHKAIEKDSKSTEKDCTKLDNKRKKAEDAVKRADVEYYTICIRSERARVDWEMSVIRGSTVLQTLENQRLSNLKNYVTSYIKLSSDMNPILEKVIERLTPTVNVCNTLKDMVIIKNIRRASEGPSEQLLPDFYCEHTTLAMNRDRRKQSLVKLLQLVRQDLERERRSRSGLKEISQTIAGNDNQNLADKLYHIRSMLTYLEGARYKLQSALFELDHKPRGSHPLAPHIQITRDRTGLQQSVLKVPLWLKDNEDETDDKMNDTSKDDENEMDHYTDEPTNQSKNDVLIKQYETNGHNKFLRSKSSLDFTKTTIEVPINGKSNTLSDNSNATDSPIWDRGIADGVSNQRDSDFDEFSSQDEDEELSKSDTQKAATAVVISKCKALYSYTPKLYDELELKPGDIIEVHVKQEDGWWLGATKTHVGIFPATYVEEIA